MSVSTIAYGAKTRRARPSPQPKRMVPNEPAPECEDCGAYLQDVVIGAQPFLRCPWAHPDSWRLDTYRVVTRIHCNWPLGGKRVVGGIRTDSVS